MAAERALLRVGEISYTNCSNLFHYLRRRYLLPGVEYVPGVPAQLNELLRRGEIDLSINSSIEYARGAAGQYLLLPGYGIGTRGPMPSIRLFSREPLERLDGARIVLTAESATTVVLLRIILQCFLGLRNSFLTLPGSLEETLEQGDAVLLIGDRALAAGADPQGLRAHDLSTIWTRHTGLPFVFALWTVRAACIDRQGDTLRDFARTLDRVHQSLEEPEEELISAVLATRPFFTRHSLLDYWRGISYRLTDSHLEGLELFYRLAGQVGEPAAAPALRFFSGGRGETF